MYALLIAGVLAVGPATDTVVVCPKAFRGALQPWVEYRTSQGRSIEILDPDSSAGLKRKIREIAKRSPVSHIVLVGDGEMRAPNVPALYTAAKVNIDYGSEPEIASDFGYADFDDDGLPEAAIGRLPVDTAEELANLVRRIKHYETTADFGPWRSRVNLTAGVGGFGSLIDTTIEMTAKQFLCDGIPSSYSTSMTYGSWRSPYCPDPRRFQETTIAKFNEGCLFWVYVGHGHPQRLDRVHVPGGAYSILENRDAAKLQCRNGSPIAVMLACYSGAYDFPQDCLAEEMLRAPNGPVAVLAGSRVTMPYAMAVLSHELLGECFKKRPATLGVALKNAKTRLTAVETFRPTGNETPSDISQRQMLDLLGGMLSPQPKLLAEERKEHVQLFNLLGDPLLMMSYPDTVEIAAAEEATAGEKLPLRIRAPHAGRCTVQLVCRRDRFTFSPPSRGEFPADASDLATFQETYVRANDPRFTEHFLDVEAGTYEAEIPVPPHAEGACHVRVFLQGKDGHAVGATNVRVLAGENRAAALKPSDSKK